MTDKLKSSFDEGCERSSTRISFAKNSKGALEVTDTNNYYPFGLNHISGMFSTSDFGSYYSYKYNGRELQETGMFDYGARMYMPDLGRWGVIDPLAEASRRFTPYHYGNNNPIRFIDPDGKLTVDNLQGGYSTGSAVADFMFRTGLSSDERDMPLFYRNEGGAMIRTEALGNDGQGGGSSFTFTGKYAISVFNYFNNGGSMSGLSFSETEITWYTGTATQNAYREGDDIYSEIDLGGIHRARIANYAIDYGKLVEDGFNWIQSHPKTFTSIAGTVEGSSQLVSWGLKKWSAASSISKSSIFAETISTGLPFSAQTLSKASTIFKWTGRAAGAVGLLNTAYQWQEGKISNARAIADSIMGVVGFMGPYGAAASLIYFGGMALYEQYGNNDKPLF